MKRFLVCCLIFCIFLTNILAFAYTYRDAPATEVPNYIQSDERWANMMYSNHGDKTQTLKKHGCGVCATANVVAYLCDSSITPIEIAKLSMKNGYVSDTGGTYITFHLDIANFYPLKVLRTVDVNDVYKCLDEGGVVIAVVGKSLWNHSYTVLHAITIYAHTEDHFWLFSGAQDNLIGQIINHGSEEKVVAATQYFYCYWAK